MGARLVWACDIQRALDPATGVLLPLEINYEATVNSQSCHFRATFESRRAEKRGMVSREAGLARSTDQLREKD